jgi:hypothetical protein
MVGFVHLHKAVAKRNALSALSSVWNGGELKGGAESKKEKHQFTSEREFRFFKKIN